MIENIVNLFAFKQFGHMFSVLDHLSKGYLLERFYLYALAPFF